MKTMNVVLTIIWDLRAFEDTVKTKLKRVEISGQQTSIKVVFT